MRSGFLGRGIGPVAFGGGIGIPADPVPVAGASTITGDSSTFTSGVGNWNNATAEGGISASDGKGILLPVNNAYAGARINGVLTVGGHFRLEFSHKIASGAGQQLQVRGSFYGGIDTFTPSVTLANFLRAGRATETFVQIVVSSVPDGSTYEIDDVLLHPLTLSSLISTRPYASADCDISAAVTRTAGTEAGLVARLDSAASPANFIIAYENGAGRVKIDKRVGGTYTNIVDAAITYVAGRVLRLVCAGNDVSVYYNGVQVGSTTAVADAGIVGNTNHGKFSTYASNTLANYVAA